MSADFTHGTDGEDEFLLDATSMIGGNIESLAAPEDACSPAGHTTGKQLRQRLITPESIAELHAAEKPTLVQRLLRRK